jgi:phage terminase small subunit
MNTRQKRFIEHFVETGNGAESARLAGYASSCAKQTAYRLTNMPEISSAIEEEHHSIQAAFGFDRNRLIRMLLHLFAFGKSTRERLAVIKQLIQLAGL